eukprot:CAMPEP_0119329706 /NCGR_PEP_ID=MMETSP1333-20130426/76529_1 /TAXON_ID=418940 /ORGANISM="Scyphosphaera apsteinii, Strain RCC1455" /LENGTH=199 /DNA_ID=CAMNT_0007338897 /DNA_START=25 /DNA_END=621 /DNA_ORIENTATION=+
MTACNKLSGQSFAAPAHMIYTDIPETSPAAKISVVLPNTSSASSRRCVLGAAAAMELRQDQRRCQQSSPVLLKQFLPTKTGQESRVQEAALNRVYNAANVQVYDRCRLGSGSCKMSSLCMASPKSGSPNSLAVHNATASVNRQRARLRDASNFYRTSAAEAVARAERPASAAPLGSRALAHAASRSDIFSHSIEDRGHW